MKCKEAGIGLCMVCWWSREGIEPDDRHICYVEDWINVFHTKDNLKEYLINLLREASQGFNMEYAEAALKVEFPEYYEWCQKMKVLL